MRRFARGDHLRPRRLAGPAISREIAGGTAPAVVLPPPAACNQAEMNRGSALPESDPPVSADVPPQPSGDLGLAQLSQQPLEIRRIFGCGRTNGDWLPVAHQAMRFPL